MAKCRKSLVEGQQNIFAQNKYWKPLNYAKLTQNCAFSACALLVCKKKCKKCPNRPFFEKISKSQNSGSRNRIFRSRLCHRFSRQKVPIWCCSPITHTHLQSWNFWDFRNFAWFLLEIFGSKILLKILDKYLQNWAKISKNFWKTKIRQTVVLGVFRGKKANLAPFRAIGGSEHLQIGNF